jgi:hypothetical protein
MYDAVSRPEEVLRCIYDAVSRPGVAVVCV